MLLLELIGLVLLIQIWKYETQNVKDMDAAGLFLRLMIVGLVILGIMIIFIDLLDFISGVLI
jgi:hypothetical protein